MIKLCVRILNINHSEKVNTIGEQTNDRTWTETKQTSAHGVSIVMWRWILWHPPFKVKKNTNWTSNLSDFTRKSTQPILKTLPLQILDQNVHSLFSFLHHSKAGWFVLADASKNSTWEQSCSSHLWLRYLFRCSPKFTCSFVLVLKVCALLTSGSPIFRSGMASISSSVSSFHKTSGPVNHVDDSRAEVSLEAIDLHCWGSEPRSGSSGYDLQQMC